MKWETFTSAEALSARAAELMFGAIHANPKIVLGLPTGRTPIGMYDRVVQECAREYRCFREVVTFNLDEYCGVPRDHPGSYFTYMKRHLFDHVDLDPRNTHIPNGMAPDPPAYEAEIRRAGGIALTFLGLGRNGHIGFNEPGTPFDSRTRVVELTQSTRHANADLFPDGHVPTHAITMGIGTILESREIVLLAAGEGKEEAIARLRSQAVSEEFPASALHTHGHVIVLGVRQR
ncbi:MAG TPA: glucosamine-6-phosphate deaminase [Thermoanaerobaculia bacterium]|jgi:glucosamine-6-phosphate deaminase|nr:glucosamine-6-phosphate deaminase [Thermoanaerobaculia bacterium]